MTDPVALKLKKRSALFFYISPLIAFWGKSKKFEGLHTIPEISARLSNTVIDPNHLRRFNEICAIEPKNKIALIYPITLVFGFFQRMLSLKQAPLSLFRVLGKRLQIKQTKALQMGRPYDIHCTISGARIIETGLELDLKARILSEGKETWSAVETFFYRGDFKENAYDHPPQGLPVLSDPQHETSWFLPEGMGFKFAKISGDGNPLHYSKRYARILGFERDFAQPFLIIGQTLDHMGSLRANEEGSLDITFKGQCYYNRKISIKREKADPFRFDIYCQGNDRPCMSARLSFPE